MHDNGEQMSGALELCAHSLIPCFGPGQGAPSPRRCGYPVQLDYVEDIERIWNS